MAEEKKEIKPITILVVDDEPGDGALTSSILLKLGFKVHVRPDHTNIASISYDLLVSDVDIRIGGSNYDAIKSAEERGIVGEKKPPVIFVTGDTEKINERRIVAEGFGTEVVYKEVDFSKYKTDLNAAIERALSPERKQGRTP